MLDKSGNPPVTNAEVKERERLDAIRERDIAAVEASNAASHLFAEALGQVPPRSSTPPQLPPVSSGAGGGLCVIPGWVFKLPLQQQCVLMTVVRGPDGIPKSHPCKDIQRAYRGTVLVAAKYGRVLHLGEKGDQFMSLSLFANPIIWIISVEQFFHDIDELPHHYVLHLLHAAEILGYKHPNEFFRKQWLEFYHLGCKDMHLYPETEEQMDRRLSDWDRKDWTK